MKAAVILCLLLVAVAPARADVNPPEVKDTAPEARENMQDHNNEDGEATCVPAVEKVRGEAAPARSCSPERKAQEPLRR